MKINGLLFLHNIFSYKQRSIFVSKEPTASSFFRLNRKTNRRGLVLKSQSSSFELHSKTVEADSVDFASVHSKVLELCKLCERMDRDKLSDFHRQLKDLCSQIEQLEKLYCELYEKYAQVEQSNQELLKQVEVLQAQVKELEADIVYFRGEY
jgi:chromosome segregation ATPase